MLLSLIVRNLRARRTRSLLTALGVGVSIAFVIAILALTNSFKAEMEGGAQITQADLVVIQRGLAGPTGSSIPEARVADIAQCEGVQRTTGFLLTTVSLSQIPSLNLFGVIPEDGDLYFSQRQLVEGGFIQSSGEIALGKLAQDILNLPIGSKLELETGDEFRVVGIYGTGDVYLDSGGIITLQEAQTIAGREGKVTVIAIYLTAEADEGGLIEQIESQWRYMKVMSASHFLATSAASKSIDTFTWALSVIAVVMACIGVMNTMTMSVSERTREIGILKSIGWSQFRVSRMVFGESLLLSLLGFGIGSLWGIGVVWVVASLPAARGLVSFSFTADALITGLVVALILGFLGGALPVYRAFRLSPTEALRYE